MGVSNTTKLTAVIGHPITFSQSPLLHNKLYAEENIDAVMLAFDNEKIEPLVAAIRALPIHLSAVTMPHKQSVMPLLDEIDAVAEAIGAVNTVVNTEGRLKGFNTDVVGVAAALKGVELSGKRVLLFGAGGAARPIAYHLREMSARMYCSNRDMAQAAELCKKFGGETMLPADIVKEQFDLIVNATPVGMGDPDASPVPAEMIKAGSAVFDIVYHPLETKLLRDAKARGARAISGLAMFIEQGLEQEHLWLGRKIEDTCYTALLEEHLRKS